MNNQRLVGYKNEVCFSNQDNHFEAGNPDKTQFNDNSQIGVLLGDILNSAQDQHILPNDHGHSQLDTPTLSPKAPGTPQFFTIHQYNPSLKLPNHSI
jgi:hypothetical protein